MSHIRRQLHIDHCHRLDSEQFNALLCIGRAVVGMLEEIKHKETLLMSQISDFSDRVNAAFDKVGNAVDGVAADVDFLKKEIERLQSTPGPISPEDQALLDGIEARVNSVVEKVEALDALTVPPAPPEPEPEPEPTPEPTPEPAPEPAPEPTPEA